ncbi:PUA-like domain-containing protein [Mycena alexandri]|uniref:PUA-like domain-containing protein n=1 Tax=Mycena alexandri TaxID=1745969 RepID=A0AAD6T5Y2_9AGAR|nr:PUA-like domain-containing protein [Mycena alexandri]
MVRPDPRIHGDICGLDVGLMFADRADLYNSGLHGNKEPGIFGREADGGAFSIVLNDGYDDDKDEGDFIIYTGEGRGKPEPGKSPKPGKNAQQGSQDMASPGNAALNANVKSEYPVRVIRGPKGNIKYRPTQGYRYDGLYNVKKAYMEEGKAGFKMCRFELQRCTTPEQVPLPLHITGEGATDQYWSPDGRERLAVRIRSGAPDTASSTRTFQQKRQEITGKTKLGNLSFRKKDAAPAVAAT